jgi:predicted DNA-binding protein with PD1-like motif
LKFKRNNQCKINSSEILKPLQELVKFVKSKNLKNAHIITSVGSLTKANIRLANADFRKLYEGHFEIVSLVGTLGDDLIIFRYEF